MSTVAEGPDLLRLCLDRLGWGPERLAREINRVAGPDTVSMKAPYGWLKGAVPRGRVPQIAALVLSRGLGELVGAAALFPGAADRTAVAATAVHGLDVPWDAAGARACAALAAVPPGTDLLPVGGGTLVSCAADWLAAPRTVPVAHRGGEPINPAVLEVLDQRIGQLRRLDDMQGGPLLLDWIMQDLRWAAHLVCAASYDDEAGRVLMRSAAELGQLGGWLAADLGRSACAQRLFLVALHCAHAAAEPELAAHIVSCLSYQSMWTGSPNAAVRLIRLARQGVPADCDGSVSALLASREGRAHAAAGDMGACLAALREAGEAESPRTPVVDGCPHWAYWVTPAVLAADAGRALLEAGSPTRAADQLELGLNLFGEDQPRNRLLHGISLAQARLALRDADGAAEAAHTALALAGSTHSARVRARMAELRAAMERVDALSARAVVERTDALCAA